MASFTSRLSLKKNDGTDKFLRQDFLDNLDKLDASPGAFICTSTTRPTTWGAAQQGRDIIETDTYRRLTWTGTGWAEPRVATGQAFIPGTPGVYVSANTSATFTLGTVVVPRPMNLMLIGNYRLSARPYLYTTVICTILVDDVDRTLGSTGRGAWADEQTSATQFDDKMFTVFGQATVAAGSHTLKARIQVGNESTNNVYVSSTSVLMLATQGSLGAGVNL